MVTVGPMLVERNSPLAWSRGTENMVIFSGKYGGDVVFSGHGAGGHPTAVAVVSDLLALAHGSRRVKVPAAQARLSAEFEVPHNIRAIVQKPGFPANALPFVMTVEPCKSSALKRALEVLRGKDYLLEEPLDLQMLE